MGAKIVVGILNKFVYYLLMPATNITQTVAALFAQFAPTVERIARTEGAHSSQWQHSAGKAARDIVQAAADDLRFGDDPVEVAAATAAKLSALEAA